MKEVAPSAASVPVVMKGNLEDQTGRITAMKTSILAIILLVVFPNGRPVVLISKIMGVCF